MMLPKRVTTLSLSSKRLLFSERYNAIIDQGNRRNSTWFGSKLTKLLHVASSPMNPIVAKPTWTRKRTNMIRLLQKQYQHCNLFANTIHSSCVLHRHYYSYLRTSSLRMLSSSTTSSPSIESSSTTIVTEESIIVERPTFEQLKLVFLHAAIPMVGFGIVDQTIMLHAGNVIDCTVGVLFGLSTLTAAAFGQLCSDSCGVLFGSTLGSIFVLSGLRPAGLTNLQQKLPIVHRVKLTGSFLGIILGCSIGLLNLLFIDTECSAELKKLEALHGGTMDDELNHVDENGKIINKSDGHVATKNNSNTLTTRGGEYYQLHIDGSNDRIETKYATMITVRGPPFGNPQSSIDGLLTTITTALYNQNCSIVEMHAAPSSLSSAFGHPKDNISGVGSFSGTFYVVKRDTKLPFTNDELKDLVHKLHDETTPSSVVMNEPSTTKELRKLVRRYSVAKVHHHHASSNTSS